MTISDRHEYIMSGLLEGWDWFDNGLQNALKEAGFQHLNKSQSMMVLYISAGVQRPIEISRRMRLSRQAIRHIQKQLMDMEVIDVMDDPTDGRSKILVLSDRTRPMQLFARDAIFRLEALLTERIGAANLAALRAALNLDWGAWTSGRNKPAPRSKPADKVWRRTPD